MRIRLLAATIVLLLLSSCSLTMSRKPLLIVERNDPMHNLHEKRFFKRVDDIEQIKKLEKLIDELPEFPNGVYHCPMDNGVNYDLKFLNTFHDITVNMTASGCRVVKIGNKQYWGMEPKGNDFRAYLLSILGLDEKEFTGWS